MQVGFIQSVEGLKNKKLRFPEENGILKTTTQTPCLGLQTFCPVAKTA